MTRTRWWFAGGCATLLLTFAAGVATAETYPLKLERLDPLPAGGARADTPADWIYRVTAPQRFFMQFGVKRADDPTAEFRKLVKKEPEEYQSKDPFRAVAKLGSGEYVFVLDAKDAESKGYSRLYFDLNGNGDLTDDKPIDAEPLAQPAGILPAGYTRCTFPRVDLTIDVAGQKVEYAFMLSAYGNEAQQLRYVSVSLNAAVYRVGEITLDGKPHKVALLDYNSNGRFDDTAKVSESMRGSEGQLYPQYGDQLLIDPNQGTPPAGSIVRPDSQGRQWVSKLARIDDRIYELEISPAGDALTLGPTTLQLGSVTNPSAPFSAVVYGDRGFLQIQGDAGQSVALPEGQWKLLSYNLQRTGWQEPSPPAEKEDTSKPEPGKAAVEGAPKAQTGNSRPQESAVRSGLASLSSVAGQGTADYKPVTVRAGETVAMPFGPPYRPVVKAFGLVPGSSRAQLSLALIGSGGEVVTSLTVNGKRPPKPTFTITDPKGEKVQEGSFEFG